MKALGVYPPIQVGETALKLQFVDVDVPLAKPRQIQIQVCYSSINIDDMHFAEGTMFGGLPVSPKPKKGLPIVLGVDVAGIVTAIGSKVSEFNIGDEVFGVHDPREANGGWAQYCCVDAAKAAIKPKEWTFGQTAASGLAGMVAIATAKSAKFMPNERVVVVGATGSIGNIITQILVANKVDVIGVCSAKNLEKVTELGARAHDYNECGFEEIFQNLDGVIDCVGGIEIEKQAYLVLKPNGRYVSLIGPVKYLGETKKSYFEIAKIFGHVAKMMFLGMLGKPKYIMAAPTSADFKAISTELAAKNITPIIDQEVAFSVEEVAKAVTYVASHRAKGKVIIKVL